MDRRFHIIITSEQGRARTFAISKKVLKKLLILSSVAFTLTMVAGLTYSIDKFNQKKIVALENNLAHLSSTNRTLQDQQENQTSGVYGELSRRNQAIDSILSTLDIPLPPSPSSGQDSGGPFTSIADHPYEELILKVDQSLEALRLLPLGYPVAATAITSGFGARPDPVNGEKAFHAGIDLRGNPGDKVKATADGKVLEQGYNADYGWYVRLNHGHDFTTLYAHNQKLLTRPGAKVVRGQTIALLGNTGRTTGPHVHYEIRRNNRPVNPGKYLNIAGWLTNNFS